MQPTEKQFGQEYIKFLLTKYLRNWYWFVISVAICAALAFAYLTTIKSVYNAQASLLIEKEQQGSSAAKQDIMEELNFFAPKKQIENEIEILKSYKLAAKVVNDLSLDVTYTIKDGWRQKDIYQASPIIIQLIKPEPRAFDKPVQVVVNRTGVVLSGTTYPFNKPVQTAIGLILIQQRDSVVNPQNTMLITTNDREDVIKGFMKRMRISQPNKMSSVLFLTVEDTAPDRGVAFLTRLIYFYELSSLQDKNKVAANTLRFVEDRLALIARELTTVEGDIQRYKTNAGIVDLSAESEVFLDKVKENDSQLEKVKLQLGALQEVESYIASKGGTKMLAPASLGLDNTTLLGLIASLLDLQGQREKLIKTVPDHSTPIESIDNQIRNVKTNINENVRNLRQILTGTQRTLQVTNRQIEATIRSIPQKERTLLDISRQASIKGNLYNYLLQKREETALSFAATVSDMRVIDDAKFEKQPVRPIKRNFYALALLIGFLIPILLLWLLDYFNNKLTRKSQIEESTEAPIIGEIILSEDRKPLQVTVGSRSLLSEQIRALRTNIQFFNPEGGKQTILVTSSVSGEGKSFISLNLGASLAITDRKVIMLELDMRKPKLHRYLSDTSTVGLSSYLSGQATLDEIIKSVPDYPNLKYIPCGVIPPNPSELLSSDRMRYLFENLRELFDVVIADTPPVGLVTDANILAKYATTTLYIVRHLYTNKSYLKNIDLQQREKRFPQMCIVINGINVKQDYDYNYGYGYESGYGYNYRSVYGLDAEKKIVARKGFSFDFWKRR